jgi:hypothetical protein
MTLSIMTFNMYMTLSIMTLSIMTLSIMTLSKMTLSIMTPRINYTLHKDNQQDDTQHN